MAPYLTCIHSKAYTRGLKDNKCGQRGCGDQSSATSNNAAKSRKWAVLIAALPSDSWCSASERIASREEISTNKELSVELRLIILVSILKELKGMKTEFQVRQLCKGIHCLQLLYAN